MSTSSNLTTSIGKALSVLPNPIPLEAFANAAKISLNEVQRIAEDGARRGFFVIEDEKVAKGPSFSAQDFAAEDASVSTHELLAGLLSYLRGHAREAEGISQARNAFELFKSLDQSHRQLLAPQLFDSLDRPVKAIGDKRLVLDVAQACIEAARHPSRSEPEAECEARARICGLSWVHQRTGELELAASEARHSLEISERLDLEENIAFCKKCLGRLNRMLAEAAHAKPAKARYLKESERLLDKAIDAFSAIPKFGKDHPEVGDCYSLLARTYLVEGDLGKAGLAIRNASKRITDTASKDYLDLQILKGDVLVAKGESKESIAFYTSVTDRAKSHDYRVSEIVARAYLQRGRALAKTDAGQARADFNSAAHIWDHFGETEFASNARWEVILLETYFPSVVTKILEVEPATIRVAAFQRLQDRNASGGNRGTLARRSGTQDATIWRQMIKEAKADITLGRSSRSK